MKSPTHRTPVALFVALTRAMREAAVHDDVRLQAYDALDRMARFVGRPDFRLELEALVALASRDGQISSTLQPFWDELRALVPELQSSVSPQAAKSAQNGQRLSA